MKRRVRPACLILLVSLTMIGGVSTACVAEENAAKDTPYTAVVNNREARFVFPIAACSHWEFGGPADKESTEYEWSVRVDNDGKPYRFGIFVTKGPGRARQSSQQAPAFFGTGRVIFPGSSDQEFLQTFQVRAQPGGMPETQDYNRLVIVITDPPLLRQLFYGRPRLAMFSTIYPGEPDYSHEVTISYQDYDYVAPPPKLQPEWSVSVHGNSNPSQPAPATAALAANARCSAIATDGAIEVVDSAGHELWRWDFAKANRFLLAGPLAVSPTCDVLAMAGSSGYRYTWIADSNGHRTPIQTRSTPLSVAFSHSGDLLALGTGGCDLLLLSKSGELKWKKDLNKGMCIVGRLSFSSDDRFILLQGQTGVVAVDGTVVWLTWDVGMNAARDLQTFVTWFIPSHGTAMGTVSLLNAAGKELWQKSAPAENTVISASGDRIAALVFSDQQMTEEEFNDSGQETELDLFSRNGEIVKKLVSGNAIPVAMSPSGDRVLVNTIFGIQAMDEDGRVLFEIPGSYGAVMVPDDFAGVLLLRGAALEWYGLK